MNATEQNETGGLGHPFFHLGQAGFRYLEGVPCR